MLAHRRLRLSCAKAALLEQQTYPDATAATWLLHFAEGAAPLGCFALFAPYAVQATAVDDPSLVDLEGAASSLAAQHLLLHPSCHEAQTRFVSVRCAAACCHVDQLAVVAVVVVFLDFQHVKIGRDEHLVVAVGQLVCVGLVHHVVVVAAAAVDGALQHVAVDVAEAAADVVAATAVDMSVLAYQLENLELRPENSAHAVVVAPSHRQDAWHPAAVVVAVAEKEMKKDQHICSRESSVVKCWKEAYHHLHVLLRILEMHILRRTLCG